VPYSPRWNHPKRGLKHRATPNIPLEMLRRTGLFTHSLTLVATGRTTAAARSIRPAPSLRQAGAVSLRFRRPLLQGFDGGPVCLQQTCAPGRRGHRGEFLIVALENFRGSLEPGDFSRRRVIGFRHGSASVDGTSAAARQGRVSGSKPRALRCLVCEIVARRHALSRGNFSDGKIRQDRRLEIGIEVAADLQEGCCRRALEASFAE
jgi:hypothetical protein